MHSLLLFVRLANRPVILIGEGESAEAKRRLLERAGARIVAEDETAALAIVAVENDDEARAAVLRLQARGILVNAADRPDLCDFTLPAIVDRDPVLVAVGTGGASAGLAAALRQRLEALIPSHLGGLAQALHQARDDMKRIWPDSADRRRALSRALAPGGAIDPLGVDPDVPFWLSETPEAMNRELFVIRVGSPDPDDLTLREARQLAAADRIFHHADVPASILDRARADAARTRADQPPAVADLMPGLTLWLEMRA